MELISKEIVVFIGSFSVFILHVIRKLLVACLCLGDIKVDY